MANTYFDFKQFRIDQDLCAMKVCTDSCILGAYVNPDGVSQILDIGTGTGLLALMLAQKTNARIDAVEIDTDAAGQAAMNAKNSPWNDRISIYNESIQNFARRMNKQYDFIISNPPFYSNYLQSSKDSINVAYHSKFLSFDELLDSVAKLLKPTGVFTCLLPAQASEEFIDKARKRNLYLNEKLEVRDNLSSPVFRVILTFTHQPSDNISIKELVIKNGNSYSESFSNLLKPYYLHL
ncbi:MAG TPA: methyltransferase [Cytophagaceae bacterium]